MEIEGEEGEVGKKKWWRSVEAEEIRGRGGGIISSRKGR